MVPLHTGLGGGGRRGRWTLTRGVGSLAAGCRLEGGEILFPASGEGCRQGKPQLVSRGAGSQGGVGDQWVVSGERKGLACTARPCGRSPEPPPSPPGWASQAAPSAPAPETQSLPDPPVQRHRPVSPRAPRGVYTRQRLRRAPAPYAAPSPSRHPPPLHPLHKHDDVTARIGCRVE
ncbi:hypothetical protein PAL_GLEAN10005306 [Pteropus alecto]|uniref:Uncharacterized protein n=1 Tax=Pteropus alecto TaxID=9402 RepID=L5JWN8_PTEAL|nr:hypothetical protein PAL_GLEAN10005306 [Pteropus alecto]